MIKKNIIQIFFVYMIFTLLMSCDDTSNKNGKSENKRNSNTILIIEPSPEFEGFIKERTGSLKDKVKFSYLNNKYENTYIFPTITAKYDTLIIEDDLDEYFLSGYYLIRDERFLYQIKKGDTLYLKVKNQLPYISHKNKTEDSLSLNYGYFETLALQNDSLDVGAIYHIRFKGAKRERYIKDYITLTARKKSYLDSLYNLNLIDSTVYSLHKYVQYQNMLASIKALPENESKKIEQILDPIELTRDLKNLSLRPFREALLKSSYDTVKQDVFIRTTNTRILNYPYVYELISNNDQLDTLTKKVLLSNAYYGIAQHFSDKTSAKYLEKLKNHVGQDQIDYINSKYLVDMKLTISDSTDLHFANQNKIRTSLNQVISENKDKLILLDFWASWCGPCIEEMPAAKELMNKYGNQKFIYAFISLDSDAEKWKGALTKHKISQYFHNYLALNPSNSQIFNSFQISSIPRYILIYPDGSIKDDVPGPSSEVLNQMIDEFLN